MILYSNTDARRQYLQCALILAFAYVLVFGWLLASTDFLPYVMDNNESFSSYWHAINLAQFDFFKSFGLTDEAYGFSAAAHPYVYTHQGNFPRLFNLLIYALGAHSIESQIAITTFTVGVAAIFMAYHFFSKIANPLCALVFCLLLITDYVLVAQWQVVTYRVWHMFFVFSSMLCVHRMVEGRRFWTVLTVINFACLFYYEFVFVAFVALASALYATFLCWRAPRKLLGFWTLQAVGGLMALSVLALQLYLYLGWDDLKMDAYLTFVARNHFQDSAELLQRMQAFFDSRNIVFWYNLEDGSRFRAIGYFLASLLFFEFQAHTPLLSTLCLTVLLALIAVLVFRAVSTAAYFAPPGEVGMALSRIRQLVLATPVSGALMLTAIHLLHKYSRDDFGGLQHAQLAALLMAVVMCVSVVEFLIRFRGTDHSETLRKAVNLLGMAIFIFNIPGIYKHISSEPTLYDQYSTFFMGYIFIFLSFFVWILWVHLTVGRTRSLSFSNILLSKIGIGAATAFSFLAFLGFFVTLLGKNLILGIQDETRQWFEPASLEYFGIALIAAACVVALLHYLGRASAEDGQSQADAARDEFVAKLKVTIVVILATLLIAGSWKLYNPRYGLLWSEMAEAMLPGLLPYILATLIMMLLSAAVMAKTSTFRDLGVVPALKSFGLFLLAGFIAYIVVYTLSPGYVFSGYRFRQVPFTIFHTMTLLALPLYVLLAVGLSQLAAWRTRRTEPRAVVPGSISACRRGTIAGTLAGAGSLVTLGIVLAYWFGVQFSYIKLMPPDQYSFLKRLSEPPYVGQSFVVNTYAAPVAAKTGAWTYLNANLMSPELAKVKDRYVVPFDTTYLWFADKRVNPDYARPAFFLCVAAQSTSTMLEELRQRNGVGIGNDGCEKNQLVQLVRRGEGESVYPALELSAVDEEGLRKVGYERWAIIKLNWTK
jgi:hypothetical protein